MNEQDDAFEKMAKDAFDSSVDKLDAATLSRLNRGRHEALQELERPRRRWSRWMPATGVAAAVLVAIVMLQSPMTIDDEVGPSSLADIEILLGEDSIEMLEELEFYSWIDVAEMESDVG